MPVQTTFPETMRQGFPGMVNRMVDFNSVTRNCATPAGIPPARAVSQGTVDTDAVIGGTLNKSGSLVIEARSCCFSASRSWTRP